MDRIVMSRSGRNALDRRVKAVRGNVAEDVAEDARRFCPIDTGRLVSTIKAKGDQVWVGGVKAPYWAAVEYGSRPHLIESHGPWPLRDRETGAVFGRHVWHPGTPAQPFMRPALMRARHLR